MSSIVSNPSAVRIAFVAAIATLVCTLRAAGAADTSAPSVELLAAPAAGAAGAIEVRVRWFIADGWLPDGGFNVYRSDRPAPLNATPIRASATAAPASLNLGGRRPIDVRSLLTKAQQVPVGTVVPKLSVSVTRPQSASAAFDRLGAQVQAARSLRGPVVPGTIASTPAASGTASAAGGTATAGGTAATAAGASAGNVSAPHVVHRVAAPLAPVDELMTARRTLALGAVLHPELASALGTSFDDASVRAGQSYTYTLRGIISGQETGALATVTVLVPSNASALKPPAPTGLRGIQLNADTVALRWERLDPAVEKSMGTARYDIYRASENGAPRQLNKQPVLVLDLADPTVAGNPRHEATSFFSDTAATTGPVTYELTVTDVFGRVSDPARFAMTIQDWRKPRALTFARAQLLALPAGARPRVSSAAPFHVAAFVPPTQSVLIAWLPTGEAGVAYRVYRVDAERRDTPALLTSTPVPGATIAASALPEGAIRQALVAQGSLASVQALTFTDRTAAKDHYYLYFVAPVFTRNSEEAASLQANLVAYPDLTPPPLPASLAASFEKSVESAASHAGPRGPRSRKTAVAQGTIVRAPPYDSGGSVSLTWNASAGAVKYRVFRANASRLSAPATHAGSNVCVPHAGGCIRPVAALSTITWQAPLKDSDFTLLTTVTSPTYSDALSRSSAHYYAYRVVPLNRWNVAGTMAEVSLRVPATMPPSTPHVLLGAPSSDGGAQVEFLPSADNAEEVVRYELWRKVIFNGVAANALGSTPSTATANALGGASGLGGASTTRALAAAGPIATRFGGGSARFGVTSRQPALAAIVRSGGSMQSALASLPQDPGTKVTDLAVAQLPADSANGTWLKDAPSADLNWRNDYAYWIRAVDKDGLVSDSVPVDITPLKLRPDAPSGLNGAWDDRQCGVVLTWQSRDSDTAGFIVERALQRSTGAQAPRAAGVPSVVSISVPVYEQIAAISPDVGKVDFSGFPGNSYYYRVRGLDKAGTLSDSVALAQPIAVPDGCGSTSAMRRRARTTQPAGTAAPQTTDAQPTETAEPRTANTQPAERAAARGNFPGRRWTMTLKTGPQVWTYDSRQENMAFYEDKDGYNVTLRLLDDGTLYGAYDSCSLSGTFEPGGAVLRPAADDPDCIEKFGPQFHVRIE